MDAVVDFDIVGRDVIYLPVQFCGGFFELWWDAFGPAFGSEASQHDQHQCDRWDSAQFMVWVAQRTLWTSTAVRHVCVQP